jgi:PEGA domain
LSSEQVAEVTVRLARHIRLLLCLLIVLGSSSLVPALHADDKILGQIELEGATKVEKTSGVWVDGQYVGYLHELKGSKKLLLLPGQHEITVRQGGYLDFTQTVSVRAGQKQIIPVRLEKDLRIQLPRVTAEIKLDVRPTRAAVFVDGVFEGHVGEFTGLGRALLVEPGKRKIAISLAGYQTFETEIDLAQNQKSTIKTDLVKGGPAQGTPLNQ